MPGLEPSSLNTQPLGVSFLSRRVLYLCLLTHLKTPGNEKGIALMNTEKAWSGKVGVRREFQAIAYTRLQVPDAVCHQSPST